MKNCRWIDCLYDPNMLSLPIVIERDNKYLTTLISTFNDIGNNLEQNDAPQYINDILLSYSSQIVDSINEYYRGNIVNAIKIVKNLLNNCCSNNKYAVSTIKESVAFKVAINNKRKNNKEIQFFKARLSNEVTNFKSEEMYHIPFDKRSITDSYRFSIPGLPCLYVGNTSYDCWLEMGCPSDRSFNVSPIVINDNLKVFNLAFNKDYLYYIFDSNDNKTEEKLAHLFKIYILNIATSFVVKEKDRKFKSEYIFSQMLMIACKEKKLDGIVYYSKRVTNEVFAISTCINVALIVDDKYNKSGISEKIYKNVNIGKSFNYGVFNQLLDLSLYAYDKLWIDKVLSFNKTIGDFRTNYSYNNTKFYKFDNFLFHEWDESEKNFEYR